MHFPIWLLFISHALCQFDPYFAPNRNTIVHLFEWKWNDIADECERFLQYKGYGGVQTSPPNENLIVEERPWWERYQPVSYNLTTRSGDEKAFADMAKRCNAVGVRIYVDTVINHMTAGSGNGTGGNFVNRPTKNYSAVPYNISDFHESCTVDNYQNATNIRDCELNGLADLDQGHDHVQKEIVQYMNHLLELGVSGFRIDAAKHMWPKDLGAIYSALNNVSSEFGLPKNSRPFIYQEVIDFGGEAVTKYEYTGMGTVLEFLYGNRLSYAFKGKSKLTYLYNWGIIWGILYGPSSVAFIDNHDNQRSPNEEILTYKNPKPYKMAIAFMLSHPNSSTTTTRLISSFAFDNKDQGPPQDSEGNLISPTINADGTCGNGYICEHRWRQIYNMVNFRNVVVGTDIANWWSNDDQQIAYSRDNKGFIAFTIAGDFQQHLNTGLSAGVYCDIISGDLVNDNCSGKIIYVDDNGYADIFIANSDPDGFLAIHINSRLSHAKNVGIRLLKSD